MNMNEKKRETKICKYERSASVCVRVCGVGAKVDGRRVHESYQSYWHKFEQYYVSVRMCWMAIADDDRSRRITSSDQIYCQADYYNRKYKRHYHCNHLLLLMAIS